jgi:putative NIF3 family GTP cyclohydrolase 1 type 2
LEGINQQLANALQLEDVSPMISLSDSTARRLSSIFSAEELKQLGTGRIGTASKQESISMVINAINAMIPNPRIERNLPLHSKVNRIALVCGSGGSFAGAAKRAGADLLITGEATYHQFLEATSIGLGMLTFGHYSSESHAMEVLAKMLSKSFPELEVWRSRDETDAYCSES